MDSNDIEKLKNNLRQRDQKIIKLINFLKENNLTLKDNIENEVLVKIPESECNLTAAAIDSGFELIEIANSQLLIYKVAGFIAKYKNGRITEYAYEPRIAKLENEYEEDLEEDENQKFASLVRLNAEISNAINIAKKLKPDIILLDGSILPLPADRPERGTKLFDRYQNLIKKYIELFDVCTKNKIMLLGVVKETKSKKFLKLLKQNVQNIYNLEDFPNTDDFLFMTFFLEEKTRSVIFPYSENKNEQIIKDIQDYGSKIFVFYIRTTKHMKPLRIEFLLNEDYKKIDQVFLSLCPKASNYSYPSVLVETDQRSRLTKEQLADVKNLIYNKVFRESAVYYQRNDLKPFG